VNDVAERAAATFRICGSCGRRWSSVVEFLDDRELSVVGLQVAGHMPEVNLMIFQHACGSTVSLLTARLRLLLPLPGASVTVSEDLFGTDRCRELCLDLGNWSTCELPCINAADRRLLKAVVDRKSSSIALPASSRPRGSGPAPAR
jgi:hypothetical protein